RHTRSKRDWSSDVCSSDLITFQDLMSQTSSPAQGSGNGRGGINAVQVGTGTQIGSIDNVHTQGNLQNTERPLDLMIDGDGFFIVEMPDGTNAYTRAGNFYLDDNGDLVNADGYYVQGDNGNINIPNAAKSFSIQKDGTVKYTDDKGEQREAGKIQLATF